MKKILFLPVFIILTGCASTQVSDSVYDRPAEKYRENTIIAWSPEGASHNFRKTIRACALQGYGIHHADSINGVITTTWRDLGKTNSTIQVTAIADDEQVRFRAQLLVNVSIHFGYTSSEPSSSTVVNKGMKDSPMRLAWEEMETLATQVSDSLTYK